MGSIVPLDTTQLGNDVRYWVHFDNVIGKLNKDIQSARYSRQKYEDSIIQKLQLANQEKAVLQITGGRILISNEKHSKPLTFASLELMLHEYFTQRPGKDDTLEIIKFIKGHREVEISHKLKRQNTAPSSA